MTQVLDASVVVSLLVGTGPDAEWSEREVQREHLAAPTLMSFEAVNIIRRTLARGAIDRTEANQAMADRDALPIQLIPYAAISARAWELRDDLTTYDATTSPRLNW